MLLRLVDILTSITAFSHLLTAGTLSCLDGYMNIALEETTEWVGGQQKNSYGDAFIRGNNGEYKCSPDVRLL
jgi:hypothetical protein